MKHTLNKFNKRNILNLFKSGSSNKPPMIVSLTGSSGNIGYALAFRVASGEMLGKDQPVILNLIDIPDMEPKLKGVKMELEDCAFPLLQGINTTSSLSTGFRDADVALLVGSRPRTKGMERGDLLKINGKIFIETGKALNDNAKRTCKTLVVGNPANTNCLIAMKNAPNLPPENFNAMTRLDHNRGIAQLSAKLGTHLTTIQKFAIWGNHSSTMYPDVHFATVNGESVLPRIDLTWYEKEYIPQVAKRGAAVIEARGASSAASAANGAIDHVRDWVLGSDDWVSMAVPSDGSYGIPKDIIYSFPCTVQNGQYKIVTGLSINEFSQRLMKATADELLAERSEVESMI